VGDAIPISARLMALVDVYDALICKRVYKPGMSHEKAVEIIVQGRGKHFDPDVVDAFLALGPEFQDIALRFVDSDAELQAKANFLDTAVGGSFDRVNECSRSH
jgi:putative two-component system response regulator